MVQITKEEFPILFSMFKAGDEKALAKLVMENQGLIGYVADRHATALHNGKYSEGLLSIIDWVDLKQSGNVGLLKALNRFDPARGCEFSTYAYRWIDKEIRLFINSCLLIKTAKFKFRPVVTSDGIRPPRSFHGLVTKKEESLIELVSKMLALLPERDRAIVRLRFGLDDGEEKSCEAIAEKFSVTRQAISIAIKSALQRLKKIHERYQATGKLASVAT